MEVSPLVDLVPQVLVLDDGTGDELGEQGDKGAEVDDVPLSPGVPPVHVDGVAHGLEGVEGDADGQVDVQHRHEGQAQGLEGRGQEVQYLKNSRRSRLKNMEEATASLAYLICPFPLKCSTSIPWVKSMAVDRNMMAT